MNRPIERIETKSKQNEKLRSLEQLVSPRYLPEAGFQSYEKLKNNAGDYKYEFMNGTIRNPDLSYPHLESLQDMDRGILNIHAAIEKASSLEGDIDRLGAVTSSLEFRAAEMEYIKLLGRANFTVSEGRPTGEVAEVIEEARVVGEQLYGAPDKEIANAALGEVWSRLDGKSFHPTAQQIYDELNEGFTWGGEAVNPLPRPDQYESLPSFESPSLTWAGEIVLENNADLAVYFDEFWEDKQALHGPDYKAYPEDIAEAYEGAFKLLDPSGESGVGVVIDSDASALSWDSTLMSVKVGGKRAPIGDSAVLFQKFLHEGKGHGGRAISGLKTGLPVLGTGLYTNTPRADYLTFEEGFCTTIENAASDTTPEWGSANLGHYINISMAESGADFRSVFETAWRYRLLMGIGDDQEVTEDVIDKHQEAAYTAAVRIFRGTPTALSEKYPDIAPLTFNKDLAYLNGRVLAMNYIDELYSNNDEAGLMELFDAKYDPTIPEQAAIVKAEFNKR